MHPYPNENALRKLPLLLLAFAVAAPVAGAHAPTSPFVQSSQDRRSFETRFKKATNIDRLLELALWAERKKLKDEAARCYRKILRSDPDHVGANRALGNVQVGNKWVPAEDAARAKEELEAGAEAARAGERKAGAKRERIVLELPSEDTDRATIAGTVRANRDPAKRFVNAWCESSGADESAYHAAISPRVHVMAKVPQEAVDQLAQIGEYVYRRLNWITWGKTDVNPFPTIGKKRFYHLAVDESDFTGLFDFCVGHFTRGFTKKEAAEAIKITNKSKSNFTRDTAFPMLMQRTNNNLASGMANTMGATWTSWNSRGAQSEINIKSGKPQGGARGRGHLVTWLKEGVGMWASIDAIGTNTTFRFSQQVYSNVGRESKGADADRIAMCYEYASNQLGKKARAKDFYRLSRSRLNELTDLDLSISWSVVDYLLRERTHEWRALVTKMRRTPTFRLAFVEVFGEKPHLESLKKVIKSKDDRGLEDVYRTVIGEFEQQWRAWAVSKYEAEYEDPSNRVVVEPPFQPINVASEASEDDDKDDKKKKKKRRRRRE